MSDRTLSVNIKATENASGVLKKVGDAATKAADDLKKAGTEGSQGLDKIEQEAKQAAPAVEKVGESARRAGTDIETVGESAQRAGVDLQAMGVALTAVGAGLAAAGQLAMEHERLTVAIAAAYGDAAQEMIGFADTLAAETGNLFNDTDILAGERFFATLVNQYDLSIQQVQELMRTTADLAAAAGIGFEDASNRVTAAIRGEAEAAEYLGLTMNQQSIDRENLTLTMSNQEAAQFRLNALFEQAQWSVGTAGAVAQTSAGQWASLTNQLKDAGQAVGSFIGPYGSMVAGMGTAAVGLAQFAGGFTALASGIRVATTASLRFAATPVGLALTAVGATVAFGTKLWMDHKEEVRAAEEQYRSMIATAEELSGAISDMRLEDWADAQWAQQFQSKAESEIQWQADWLEDTILKSFSYGDGSWFDKLVQQQMSAEGFDVSRTDLAIQWGQTAEQLFKSMVPDDADKERFNTAMLDLLSLRGVVGDTHWDAIQNEMDRLLKAFDLGDGKVSIDDLNGSLESLYENNLQAAQGFDASTLAVNNLTAAQTKYNDLGYGSMFAVSEEYQFLTSQIDTAADATARLIALEEKRQGDREGRLAQATWWDETYTLWEEEEARAKARVESRKRAAEEIAEGERQGLLAQANYWDETRALWDEERAAQEERVKARMERANELLSLMAGTDDPLNAFNTTDLASSSSELAANFRDANVAAGDLYRVIVGNTDAIKSQADATLDWATELINVRGELGRIDELVNQGLLTGTSGVFDDGSQYAAAQNAYDSIAISTAQITDNLDAIQAIQSPLIAEMQAQQAELTNTLLEQDAATQLITLGWMDAATAAKAMEVQTLAVAAANGELGSNGEAIFTSFVDSIVQTQPALAALLEDMGLIQNVVRDSSGMILSYEVKLDGAEGAKSEIELLTESVDRLTAAILGIPVAELYVDDQATPAVEEATTAIEGYDGKIATGYVVGDNSDAMGIIDESLSALNNLDGDTATVSVNAEDNASGTLSYVQSLINGLDGRIANTYVNTIYGSREVGPTRALGGVVQELATGGVANYVPFYGAEGNRPELLHFAMGGTAPIYTEGMYAVPPMTYVSPANANPGLQQGGGINLGGIHVYGNIYGIDDLAEQVTAQIVPAIQEASGTRYREQGVRW